MALIAKRYDTGLPVRVELCGDRIASVTPAYGYSREDDLPFVAPGFFDLQINGYGGVWFSDPHLTEDAVLKVLRQYLAHGVTRLCPTLITNSREALCAGLSAIRRACEREAWANRMVPGCHVEGPFISAEDGPRGAHPREHVRPCDWDELEAQIVRLLGDDELRSRLVGEAYKTIASEFDVAKSATTLVSMFSDTPSLTAPDRSAPSRAAPRG